MNKPTIKKLKYKNPPGTIIYTGDSSLDTKINHYAYRNNHLEERESLYDYSEKMTDWISVEGFKDIPKIKDMCEKLKIDNLIIEDIFNVTQRNKIETTNDYIFVVLKYATLNEGIIKYDYISVILKSDCIVTFTDYENPFKTEVLDRIINEKAYISKYNEDYLLYVIYDLIVDEQIEIVKSLAQKLYEYETIILDAETHTGASIYKIHKELVVLRNNVKAMHDNISPYNLMKTGFVTEGISKYLLDLDDHLKNLVERINISIDVCNSMILLYSNQLSNKTNEIMKTLTIISVVFIPLSFFAGVFGMNFVNFEILKYKFGVPIFFILSIIIIILMLYYFKRKKWF